MYNYDKIVIENEKSRQYGNQRKFLHKSPSKRWCKIGIHSLIMRADDGGSADIFYRRL